MKESVLLPSKLKQRRKPLPRQFKMRLLRNILWMKPSEKLVLMRLRKWLRREQLPDKLRKTLLVKSLMPNKSGKRKKRPKEISLLALPVKPNMSSLLLMPIDSATLIHSVMAGH